MTILTAACAVVTSPTRVISPTAGGEHQLTPEVTHTSTVVNTLAPTDTAIPTRRPGNTPSPVPTHSPTDTSTIYPSQTLAQFYTPTTPPTYTILRGTVLMQSNCRYGPGAAYLYKYGLYEGNNLEIIGRNDTGTWIMVQAIGGSNPCWLKASLMDIHGDIQNLAPTSSPLPQSPYYGPLSGVSSVRDGDNVIISWNPLYLRAGDDSEQYPYLIEAWLCHDGVLTFEAIGSWETIVTVMDVPGCTELSHARVYGVEKHGYTSWVNVPWTQP